MNQHIVSILAIAISTCNIANAAEVGAVKLLAGAATSNITPELGIDVVGGFVPFPATHIHDELHARCLVLDDGKTKLAMVVCDLLGVHRSLTVEARQLIEKATGIPAANIMISATHTHSAGNAIGPTPRGYFSDQELTDYQRFVAHRIADGVQRAMKLRRPAEIAFGTAEAPEHVFNRRWIMKPGTLPVTPFGVTTDKVKMNPGSGDPNLVEPAGPTDPTVSFIALREPAGRLISVFSAYSLHYVGGVGEGHISADYYGMYCEALKRLQPSGESDPPFVAMMANGTSGDINNINFRTPRPRMPPYTQMRIVAEDIAKKVNAALANVTWKDYASLDARYRELGLAWRKVEPELLDWAKETEAKAKRLQSKEDKTSVYAGRVQRLANASPETKAPVQVLRIGDVCIGSSPCETFAETGLEFKERSPIRHSFMVELANGYYGYLPSPRHFELGGYETWPGTNNLEPQASVKIMDALLEMAAELGQNVSLKPGDAGTSVESDRQASPRIAAAPVTVENIRRVFHNGEHNAFTDLIRWRGKFWLTFRSCPDGHGVSSTASIIVLSSTDAKTWTTAHRFSVPQRDTRDPHFLVFKDQLFIYSGTWYAGDGKLPREKYNLDQHLGFAVWTENGTTWQGPRHLEGTFGHYVWRAAEHKEKAFLCGRREYLGGRQSALLESTDGLVWKFRSLFQDANGNETAFMIGPNSQLTAICRNTAEESDLLRSSPPYGQWTRLKIPEFIGGPLLVKWGERVLVGGRHATPVGPKTKLAWLIDDKLVPCVDLPSGGDNSYPGFVEIDDRHALVSWYSSHEKSDDGKPITAIYLADLVQRD